METFVLLRRENETLWEPPASVRRGDSQCDSLWAVRGEVVDLGKSSCRVPLEKSVLVKPHLETV